MEPAEQPPPAAVPVVLSCPGGGGATRAAGLQAAAFGTRGGPGQPCASHLHALFDGSSVGRSEDSSTSSHTAVEVADGTTSTSASTQVTGPSTPVNEVCEAIEIEAGSTSTSGSQTPHSFNADVVMPAGWLRKLTMSQLRRLGRIVAPPVESITFQGFWEQWGDRQLRLSQVSDDLLEPLQTAAGLPWGNEPHDLTAAGLRQRLAAAASGAAVEQPWHELAPAVAAGQGAGAPVAAVEEAAVVPACAAGADEAEGAGGLSPRSPESSAAPGVPRPSLEAPSEAASEAGAGSTAGPGAGVAAKQDREQNWLSCLVPEARLRSLGFSGMRELGWQLRPPVLAVSTSAFVDKFQARQLTYGDLSPAALHTMCSKAGIQNPTGFSKEQLAQLLVAGDEGEEAAGSGSGSPTSVQAASSGAGSPHSQQSTPAPWAAFKAAGAGSPPKQSSDLRWQTCQVPEARLRSLGFSGMRELGRQLIPPVIAASNNSFVQKFQARGLTYGELPLAALEIFCAKAGIRVFSNSSAPQLAKLLVAEDGANRARAGSGSAAAPAAPKAAPAAAAQAADDFEWQNCQVPEARLRSLGFSGMRELGYLLTPPVIAISNNSFVQKFQARSLTYGDLPLATLNNMCARAGIRAPGITGAAQMARLLVANDTGMPAERRSTPALPAGSSTGDTPMSPMSPATSVSLDQFVPADSSWQRVLVPEHRLSKLGLGGLWDLGWQLKPQVHAVSCAGFIEAFLSRGLTYGQLTPSALRTMCAKSGFHTPIGSSAAHLAQTLVADDLRLAEARSEYSMPTSTAGALSERDEIEEPEPETPSPPPEAALQPEASPDGLLPPTDTQGEGLVPPPPAVRMSVRTSLFSSGM